MANILEAINLFQIWENSRITKDNSSDSVHGGSQYHPDQAAFFAASAAKVPSYHYELFKNLPMLISQFPLMTAPYLYWFKYLAAWCTGRVYQDGRVWEPMSSVLFFLLIFFQDNKASNEAGTQILFASTSSCCRRGRQFSRLFKFGWRVNLFCRTHWHKNTLFGLPLLPKDWLGLWSNHC